MTNSLFKDSHITHKLCYSQIPNSGNYLGKRASKSERKEYSSATVNKIGISVNKPADNISFRGLSNVELANSKTLQNLYDNAQKYLEINANSTSIKALILASVNAIQKTGDQISEETSKFLRSSSKQIRAVIKNAEVLIKDENKKNPLKSDVFKTETEKTIKSAIEGYDIIKNQKLTGIHKNTLAKRFFNLAAESEPLFNATFSIVLTCILRPASIMSLPGQKKNKDDKKYAAAQSIASGVIAYMIALAIFNPIAKSMKKIASDPAKVLKASSKLLGDKRAMDTAGTFIKMIPETILAAPRAMVTIALIPPVLKYVFGWEKKKPENKTENTQKLNKEGVKK